MFALAILFLILSTSYAQTVAPWFTIQICVYSDAACRVNVSCTTTMNRICYPNNIITINGTGSMITSAISDNVTLDFYPPYCIGNVTESHVYPCDTCTPSFNNTHAIVTCYRSPSSTPRPSYTQRAYLPTRPPIHQSPSLNLSHSGACKQEILLSGFIVMAFLILFQ